jgi:hypothetical protein
MGVEPTHKKPFIIKYASVFQPIWYRGPPPQNYLIHFD